MGLGEPDDAAVFRLDDTRALIKTTDFFTPVVDDPWTYGAIAAANAMSDVYAMGGDVLFCLNIAGFPDSIAPETVAQIFAGGAVKVREAGAAIAGGHTVKSPEPFYGLSVTGIIHPDAIMRKGGAQPGDALFLTKPLGTGIITTAAKLTGSAESGRAPPGTAHAGQTRPRPQASRRRHRFDAAAQPGGLAGRAPGGRARGHGYNRLWPFGPRQRDGDRSLTGRASAGFVVHAAAVPALDGVWDYIAAGYMSGATGRNPSYYGINVTYAAEVTPAQRTLLWEAETSGGLLLAVPAASVGTFTAACDERKQAYWQIGEVVSSEGIHVV